MKWIIELHALNRKIKAQSVGAEYIGGMKDCKRQREITYKTGPSTVGICAERFVYP